MGFADFSPNGSELGSLFLGWGFINVYDSFSQIVVDFLLGIDVLDFHQSLRLSLIFSVSSETQKLGFNPESDWGLFVLSFALYFCLYHCFINISFINFIVFIKYLLKFIIGGLKMYYSYQALPSECVIMNKII